MQPAHTTLLQSARKNARDSHAGHNDASRRIARGRGAGVVLQAAVVAVRRVRGAEKRRLPAGRHLEGQSRLPPPRHRRDDSIARAQAVYQRWKDQKDGKASTPAVSDAYDYGYRGRSEYALDMPRSEFKFCPPREMTGVPVEITRACATFSGQMYEVMLLGRR